jgi:dTDP-4-dehydrorhamnose 3,5-epimerase-like enzyme
MKITKLELQSAKKVNTYDVDGKPNGWLMELFKDKETGQKTEAYLTAALPGAFKGYHLHRVRAARYVAIKGKMKITCYEFRDGKWQPTEFILSADNPQRLLIPKNVATGLENIDTEEALLINYPDPAYDPSLKDEQVEYTKEELEKGIVK